MNRQKTLRRVSTHRSRGARSARRAGRHASLRSAPAPSTRWIALVLLPSILGVLILAGTFLSDHPDWINEAKRILAALGSAYALGLITALLHRRP